MNTPGSHISTMVNIPGSLELCGGEYTWESITRIKNSFNFRKNRNPFYALSNGTRISCLIFKIRVKKSRDTVPLKSAKVLIVGGCPRCQFTVSIWRPIFSNMVKESAKPNVKFPELCHLLAKQRHCTVDILVCTVE
jgi:hypothetical protein